jgi:hypothetical protein
MAYIKGWRLIRLSQGELYFYNCLNGQVDYNPNRKYRLEKRNAFDPTIKHQRDEYREDTFELQAILRPSEYYALINFITAPGMLYLEYTAHDKIRSQFPVTLVNMPKCPDDLHEYPEKIKFSLESRYIGSPGYIQFDYITGEDDDVTYN